ncbi:acetaldehyde dehydrogenase (acetylating) [Tissierella sp. Yu-01]|uniref:acetaldehyde dehydrogenase (acetylating) n=1 Tax=Tissierella sp. Yu-01 TaxID=3035694 RepID=UPI00240DC457|nr:acetaldehyde dehydrogenase (acetylating) [Tissierella sp. Yu-01]WFA08660.1 acetaldehyde dehydrogenase (acetylating) [Tissierella sp. Yu-01]
MGKVKVGIIGPGNIGLDLLYKLGRSEYLTPELIVNIRHSKGIDYANNMGIRTSTRGVQAIIEEEDIKIVFDCTSASAHLVHAPLLKEAGKFAIDLTPAAVGPYCVPAVNLTDDLLKGDNVNLVTCAGQATVPIVAAINELADVKYAEIVSSISSKSAGPGTRRNIDEFTVTTGRALREVGGADESKVIIILNPAEPPIYMRNTIYTKVKNTDINVIKDSVYEMVDKIKEYVPGYRVMLEPIIQDDIVTTMIEVEGLGDYLPVYSGNLDIINAAAVNIAETYAKKILAGGEANA